MKTSELTGAALDWAVAKCESVDVEYVNDGITQCLLLKNSGRYAPSTDWSQGGPSIEREGLGVVPSADDASVWVASIFEPDWKFNRTGPTPLIAAMRCYVASKLGDEIDLPKELV